MALEGGTRLGPYEILSPLGAGGMGEVYLARDTRLERTVAIKILPERLSKDSQLRERFEREARTVSSLNHPHICTLHDIGCENGVDFMVMEHIEGESLADRLRKGALPLDQAFRYAIEIADALDKAHRRGVVHRDLKPGNIMLGRSGAKLLDFGLAKLATPDSGPAESALPTEEKPLTAEGSILGTFQYMAPEQLEGKEADNRTDIFAFGATLYEMVTGRRAFEGSSRASLISAIMGTDPEPVSAVRTLSPPALDRAVACCLAKDPDDRWQSAGDLMRELRWIAADATETAQRMETRRGRTMREWLAWGLVAALAGVAAWASSRPSLPTPGAVSRLVVNLPEGQRLTDSAYSFAAPIALSPDGTRFVYSATTGSRPQLYLRRLDQFEAKPIAGTEGGTSPFFSPNGEWLGFFAHGRLQKVPVSGGAPQTICEVPYFIGNGISWGADGTIVYAATVGSGLMRVSAEGGSPEPLTTPVFENGEYAHTLPQILPDGRNVLFAIWGGQPAVALLSLDTGQWRSLLTANGSVNGVYYLPTGHIIYGNQTSGLVAVGFDAAQLRVLGDPVPVLAGFHAVSYSGRPSVAVSESALVYEPSRVEDRSLVWVSRTGEASSAVGQPAPYLSPALAPDGDRLLFLFHVPDPGIWTYEFARGARTRVTNQSSSAPTWSHDGREISYASRDVGSWNLTSRSADGVGEARTLLERDGSQFPMSWSPDGQTLAYYDYGPTTGRDIWLLTRGGDPTPFIATPFNEYMLRFSPDGRFVAYVSDESGQEEVYAQPFPGPGERTILSTGGGRAPVWAADGRELFYRNGDDLFAVALTPGDTLVAGRPQRLFSGHFATDLLHNYDAAADGQRFLMVQEHEELSRPRLHVVLNWRQELDSASQN